ncbi:hypothetical protein NDU88_001993 [Pleurodeles waltl]|uniref:Uncharacterized protein n=1 Tax=Pleurodeles waltl TaxID=8319 RepID=A0AAV7TJD5_PLEWA|nr:hypothetical protein NDU88_001993 [Pleurodeles waltl]
MRRVLRLDSETLRKTRLPLLALPMTANEAMQRRIMKWDKTQYVGKEEANQELWVLLLEMVYLTGIALAERRMKDFVARLMCRHLDNI